MKILKKIILFASIVFFNNQFIQSQGQDTLIATGGDRLVGEIVSMKKTVLTFETEYSDSDFKIKWQEIFSLKTSTSYKVMNNSGDVLLGRIEYNREKSDSLIVYTQEGEIYLELLSVVEISEMESRFMDKLRLGVNVGYSYTKANSSQQIAIRSNAGYVTDRWNLSSAINSFDTRIGDVVTSRSDASVHFRHVLANNWFTMVNLDWLNSDEQQLDLRTTAVVGAGNYLVRNYQMELLLYGGVGYNNEIFSNTEGTSLSSMETFVAGQYDLFGASDVNIINSFVVYPSLTENDRVRANYKVDLAWDIIYDFEMKLGFTLNYDSNPPNNAVKSDYVFSLTFGWSL